MSEAETFDGGEDVIGGLCPYEGLGSFVMCFDEGKDVVFQCGCGAVNASADAVIGDEGEEALDLIDPGCSGWRVVDMPARALEEPVSDQRRFVGGIVVHDDVNVEIERDLGLDPIKECAEFAGAVTRDGPGHGFLRQTAALPIA